jgi:peptide/nickel transport system substrate-binding protein
LPLVMHTLATGQVSIHRGQNLTGHLRNPAVIVVIVAAAVSFGCRNTTSSDAPRTGTASSVPDRGGDLVVAVRTEPQSFNYYVARDATTDLVTRLTQARLARVNRATQEVEPWLAESWTRSDDGLRYTVKLRPNVAFADGHPFTADDVVFSFAAVYAAEAGSTLADSLKVNGQPLVVTAPDPQTVVIAFPAPFGPGIRLLDNLPILPKHKLDASVSAGTFGSVWGLSTAPADITGLGPFMPVEYTPGQRLVFARNPRYFRLDERGTRLPYLDRVILEVVPDQDAQMLRLEAGQIDMTRDEVRPEDYAPLKRAADRGQVRLLDLGVGLDADGLWINLKPGAFGSDPRAAWLQRDELRLAISHAVDRQHFDDTVFLGAGAPLFGPVTPANKKWYSPDVPQTPYDPARAKALLASIGLSDRNGDGTLEDAKGGLARFTITTQKGQTAYERGAAVIRDELKKIGIIVDIAAIEGNAATQLFGSGKYEAGYFRLLFSDTDPALTPDLWLSSGSAHVWNLGQTRPATPWERRIDELMQRQAGSVDEAERKRLFTEVQMVFAQHLPIVYFVAPPVYVAASSRVTNLAPAVQRPQLLWSADALGVRP